MVYAFIEQASPVVAQREAESKCYMTKSEAQKSAKKNEMVVTDHDLIAPAYCVMPEFKEQRQLVGYEED